MLKYLFLDAEVNSDNSKSDENAQYFGQNHETSSLCKRKYFFLWRIFSINITFSSTFLS